MEKPFPAEKHPINKRVLEDYIHKNIPISLSLGLQVEQASLKKVVLSAPLSNNINHKKTVFGGSLHAVATLASWSLLYLNLRDVLDCSEIVIAHSDIHYLLPVTTDFKVQCLIPNKPSWERFLKILNRMNKARIKISAQIFQQGKLSVDYQGDFVALNKKTSGKTRGG